MSVLSLIEDSINQKNNDKIISELSLRIAVDTGQILLFLKYFKKFIILSSILDSEYVNYFNKINLIDLKEDDDLTNENFVKAIIIFIKYKRKNKHLYFVNMQTENDIKLHILILSQLDYKSFKYDISYNEQLNLKDNLTIFNYMYNINDEYAFESLSKELVEKKIDSPLINRINLDNISYDKVLEYSQLFPNRIKSIDFYIFKDYNKIKKLMELNKNSLISYPHAKLEFLIPLQNAYIFTLTELSSDNLDIEYNLSKINIVNGIKIGDNEENLYINFLNKCNNIEQIHFGDISSEHLFKILKNINCPKIKRISAICEDLERDCDWLSVFEKMPLLEDLSIVEHQTMWWTYEIEPIFLAEVKRLPFPLLEQLIRNYLNGSPERDIKLSFDDEFDEFWDYFKDKNDILSRVSKLKGDCVYVSLDEYYKGIVNEYYTIDKIQETKYKFFFIETSFDLKILEFIKKNKIEYLFIKNGADMFLDEIIKCNHLKFVFDQSSKIFLFSNNGILERI